MATVVAVKHRAMDIGDFRRILIGWGQQNFQPFAWRQTENPYNILMAEVMLHRTQAIQVAPVYEQFIARYPNATTLAKCTLEELQHTLYSLGLRWRIDLIYSMARELVTCFDGNVPKEKSDLVSLTGVNEYIAGAVRCFAWNLPEPLIDTNTVRVTGRMFGLEIKDSSRRNQRFRGLITALVDPIEPRAYQYALLDLAHQLCTKGRPPQCPKCPLREYCVYGAALISDSTIALSVE